MEKLKNFALFRIMLTFFADTIELAKIYTTVLDRVYQAEAKTMVLEAPDWLKRAGATAKSVLLPKVTVTGLKNYSRTAGYLSGDNTFEYEEHTYAIDRGIEIKVDRADDMETVNQAFTYLITEFTRTQVVPEIDAYRLATVAGRAIAGQTIEANLTADTALQAWDEAIQALDDQEVPEDARIAFVSPEFKKWLKQSNLIERQFITQRGGMVIDRKVETLDGVMLIKVPQKRLQLSITLQTGNDSGYIKTPTTGRDVNFLIMDPMAGLSDKKIDKVKVFDPDTYQNGDFYVMQCRIYHDTFTPDNKVNSIYVHHKTS